MKGGKNETQKEDRLDVQSGTDAPGAKNHPCGCSGICDGGIRADRELDAVFHGNEIGGENERS